MRTIQPFLRLSTGVDWRHRHLFSERKYPEIYSVYFTGSYSLDYSAVRHSPLHYLLLILHTGITQICENLYTLNTIVPIHYTMISDGEISFAVKSQTMNNSPSFFSCVLIILSSCEIFLHHYLQCYKLYLLRSYI